MSIVNFTHELAYSYSGKQTVKPDPNPLLKMRSGLTQKALPTIAFGKIKPVIKMLTTEGVKLTDLLEDTGIQLSQLALYDSKISYDQYFKLIENACRLSPDPTFALRLGEQFYINHDGILACRVMSCENASCAMHLLADYQSLLTQLFHLDFSEYQDYAVFTAQAASSFTGNLPYFIEYIFSSIYSLGKFCTGQPDLALELEFSYDGKGKQADYCNFFGSNIRFNCEHNRVIISKAILKMPFIFENSQTAKLNDKICQDKIRLVHQNTSIIDQVRMLLVKNQFTNISLQMIAEKLCMSPRTLRRHLSNENFSYKDLLESERKRVVRSALNRNIPMKQVAEQLGYRDASSFSRAFKKWFGISPNEYKGQAHTLD